MPSDTTSTELAPIETQRPASLKEAKLRGAGVPMAQRGGSFLPSFSDAGQMMEFAALMSGAGVMVGPAVRGNPGACAGVIMMAGRFALDPFLLSTKAYVMKNKAGVEVLSWEAQAIYAMLLGSGALDEPLDFIYSGEGVTRCVTVVGRLAGSTKLREITTSTVGNITIQNSPLWKSEPDQQLAYYGSRLWARRHAPHVLMGVYDREEAIVIEGQATGFIEASPEKLDPVARLKANMEHAKPVEAAKQPDPPEPDPPAAAQPIPPAEPDADDDEAEPLAAETGGEAGEEPAAEAESSVRELPPHPGELIRTKKGALEWAERWATYWTELPKADEDAFFDETEEMQRLAVALNPEAEDVISDALNAPKLPI